MRLLANAAMLLSLCACPLVTRSQSSNCTTYLNVYRTASNALNVVFPTTLSTTYQLQSSTNLTIWANVGQPFSTSNASNTIAVAAGKPYEFYRMKVGGILLGTALFDCNSDQMPTNSYWPMPTGIVRTYTGYGDYAGYSMAEQYYIGESVAGVKAVKMHSTGNHPTDTWTEDWWVARDVQGDLRVLKLVSSSGGSYETSPTNTPPIILPAQPVVGQSWDLLGIGLTITSTNATFMGYSGLLALRIVMDASDTDINYYQLGIGCVVKHWNDSPPPSGSGWRWP